MSAPAIGVSEVPNAEALLTPEDVARRLRVPVPTVRAWFRRGRLSGLKVGKLVRFAEADVAAFLEAARAAGRRSS